MKILVTGGAGYIGSVTAEMLIKHGYEVAILDNFERGHREAIPKGTKFYTGDLRNQHQTLSIMHEIQPDAVMHFAAYALVPESMQKPEMYFQNNVVGGLNLLNAMLNCNVRKIVFSSSCATYGQPEKIPITEDLPQRPTNPYGESKLMFERIMFWYHELYGIQAVSLRYFNAAGATESRGEDHYPETHLIPLVLQTALGRKPEVYIYGDDYDTPDGTCIRDYIHILDLAEAHILALKGQYSGALNLGNGVGYSVKQVIETARAITEHPIPARVKGRRPGDPPRLIASAEKARNTLGWKPQFPELHHIIESAWKWHKVHPNGYSGQK